ncbi:hypothetical protein MMYC01_207296 [Madurella mycetomatis]|uniref:Arb2 domain-containing protein n=1 Tax=Madurella mycetomatis TaxID=100816 RepID=A0A175VXT9_9PEZI|nr:hypothetical protein MMYC01_207296 [Madurella mycetomatis]
MFRRRCYFVNDIDEIRSIEDPDSYFKYFLTKNERWNGRQCYSRPSIFTSFGCPVYSAGGAIMTEKLLIETQSSVLGWIQQVTFEGEAYKNEEFEIIGEENGHCAEPEEVECGVLKANPTW